MRIDSLEKNHPKHTYHKSKAVLEEDLTNAAISFEKLFNVSLAHIVRDAAHIDTATAGHDDRVQKLMVSYTKR